MRELTMGQKLSPKTVEHAFVLNGISYDQQDGLGSVPLQNNVNYMGYTVLMTPDEFLHLNPTRRDELSKDIKDRIQAGLPIASPWLDVEINDAGQLQVFAHEGRGRAMVLQEMLGPGEAMPVNIFVRGGLRAHDLTEEQVLGTLLPDDRTDKYVKRGRPFTPRVVIWKEQMYRDGKVVRSLSTTRYATGSRRGSRRRSASSLGTIRRR